MSRSIGAIQCVERPLLRAAAAPRPRSAVGLATRPRARARRRRLPRVSGGDTPRALTGGARVRDQSGERGGPSTLHQGRGRESGAQQGARENTGPEGTGGDEYGPRQCRDRHEAGTSCPLVGTIQRELSHSHPPIEGARSRFCPQGRRPGPSHPPYAPRTGAANRFFGHDPSGPPDGHGPARGDERLRTRPAARPAGPRGRNPGPDRTPRRTGRSPRPRRRRRRGSGEGCRPAGGGGPRRRPGG